MSVRLCVNSENQLVLEKNGNQKIIPTHVELPTAACGRIYTVSGSTRWQVEYFINGDVSHSSGRTTINISQP